MSKKLLALLLGTSLVLAACGGDDSSDEPANGGEDNSTTADAGQEAKLFEQKCSSCHGQNLEGGVGPELKTVGSKLSKEEIETIIVEGKGSMPKGLLTGDDASAVAAWLAEKK